MVSDNSGEGLLGTQGTCSLQCSLGEADGQIQRGISSARLERRVVYARRLALTHFIRLPVESLVPSLVRVLALVSIKRPRPLSKSP